MILRERSSNNKNNIVPKLAYKFNANLVISQKCLLVDGSKQGW